MNKNEEHLISHKMSIRINELKGCREQDKYVAIYEGSTFIMELSSIELVSPDLLVINGCTNMCNFCKLYDGRVKILDIVSVKYMTFVKLEALDKVFVDKKVSF